MGAYLGSQSLKLARTSLLSPIFWLTPSGMLTSHLLRVSNAHHITRQKTYVKTKLISVSLTPSRRYDKIVPCGPIQWLFRGVVMRSSSSGMPLRVRVGRVTRYTICPVGTGCPGLPRTISRHIECKPYGNKSIQRYELGTGANLTIRRNDQVSRVTFSALRDEGGPVRIDLDDTAVEVHSDAKISSTLE